MATVERRGKYYEATWYTWNPLTKRRERRRRSTHATRKDTAQTIADGFERDEVDAAVVAVRVSAREPLVCRCEVEVRQP